MAIRMRTGTIVQATSSQVWCVVFEGTGFLASLKRTAIMMISASTNTQIAAISQTR